MLASSNDLLVLYVPRKSFQQDMVNNFLEAEGQPIIQNVLVTFLKKWAGSQLYTSENLQIHTPVHYKITGVFLTKTKYFLFLYCN